MSFEMEEECENFDKIELACFHCTKEKIKIQGDICFKEKKNVEEISKQGTYTIKCVCGWIGKTEETIDILAKVNLEHLFKKHVSEEHYKEFIVTF